MFYDDLISLMRTNISNVERGTPDRVGFFRMVKDVKQLPKQAKKLSRRFGRQVNSRNFSDTAMLDTEAGQLMMQYLLYLTKARSALTELQQEARLFLLEYIVVDTLYNERHGNINYTDSIRLPFPTMFFEFDEPFEIRRLNGESKELMGMLFRKSRDKREIELQTGFNYLTGIPFLDNYIRQPDTEEIPEDSYHIDNFYRSEGFPSEHTDQIDFRVSELPSFRIVVDNKSYWYNHNSQSLQILNTDYGEFLVAPGGRVLATSTTEEIGVGDERVETALRNIDLTLNVINYINAQNVEIRSGGGRRGPAVNPGQREIPSRPYYWVEVKKEVIEPHPREESSWTLNYRVWVRGHFRHHQNGQCLWINHYIKGPPHAPWKHNRYKVLYEKTIRPYLERQSQDNIIE